MKIFHGTFSVEFIVNGVEDEKVSVSVANLSENFIECCNFKLRRTSTSFAGLASLCSVNDNKGGKEDFLRSENFCDPTASMHFVLWNIKLLSDFDLNRWILKYFECSLKYLFDITSISLELISMPIAHGWGNRDDFPYEENQKNLSDSIRMIFFKNFKFLKTWNIFLPQICWKNGVEKLVVG